MALHHLAQGLGERAPYSGGQRRLFQLFLDRGVDVNARNFEGRTCVWVYFDDDGERGRWVEREYPRPGRGFFHQRDPPDEGELERIDGVVFDMVDVAGVD